MSKTESSKIFKSDDPSLSFSARMKMATVEKENEQRERDVRKKAEAEDILLTVDNFITEIVATKAMIDKFVESVVKTYSRRKVVEIFTFNTNAEHGELYNKELPSATIEGKTYPIRYVLNETYQNLVKRYFPERVKPLKDLIYEKINTPEYNNGVDLETKEKLIVCIFLYKKPNSKFKNGIYISRDGVDYNGNYSPAKRPDKN